MPATWALRLCPMCNVRREREEFPVLGQKNVGTVCVRCMAKPKPLSPCRGCGEMRNDFPVIGNNKIWQYCEACRARTNRKKACTICKQEKLYGEFFRYSNGHWSGSCNDCRKPFLQSRTCVKCKHELPIHAFHRYGGGTLSTTCHSCRRPSPRGPKGPQRSEQPCTFCKKYFYTTEAPSRRKRRKTCSKECSNNSRRHMERTCVRCKRTLPADHFGKHAIGKNPKGSCKHCETASLIEFRGEFYHRPSIHQMKLTIQRRANALGVANALTKTTLRKLHKSPCMLCGKAASGIDLIDEKLGFTHTNCRPVCKLCRTVLKVCKFHELFLLAHEIANYRPLCDKPADDAPPST